MKQNILPGTTVIKQTILLALIIITGIGLGANIGQQMVQDNYPITKVYEDGSFVGCTREGLCND